MSPNTKKGIYIGLGVLALAGIVGTVIYFKKKGTPPVGSGPGDLPDAQYPENRIVLQPTAASAQPGDKVLSTNSRNIYKRVINGAGVPMSELEYVKNVSGNTVIGYFVKYLDNWRGNAPFAYYCPPNGNASQNATCEQRVADFAPKVWNNITTPSRGILVLNTKKDNSGTELWVGMGEDNYGLK